MNAKNITRTRIMILVLRNVVFMKHAVELILFEIAKKYHFVIETLQSKVVYVKMVGVILSLVFSLKLARFIRYFSAFMKYFTLYKALFLQVWSIVHKYQTQWSIIQMK